VDSTPGHGSTFYFTVPLTPIEEVEPIKVLFSARAEIERRVQEEFMAALGPMGIVEYNEQKNKHALGKQDLLEYITALEEVTIVKSHIRP
jgi:hypothetical protein